MNTKPNQWIRRVVVAGVAVATGLLLTSLPAAAAPSTGPYYASWNYTSSTTFNVDMSLPWVTIKATGSDQNGVRVLKGKVTYLAADSACGVFTISTPNFPISLANGSVCLRRLRPNLLMSSGLRVFRRRGSTIAWRRDRSHGL